MDEQGLTACCKLRFVAKDSLQKESVDHDKTLALVPWVDVLLLIMGKITSKSSLVHHADICAAFVDKYINVELIYQV